MFRKLLEKAETAGFKAAASKGRLACPACGIKPATVPPSARSAIVCAHCGTAASAVEWAAGGPTNKPAVNPDQPPALTKITRENDAFGATVWNIPASGRSGGLLVFAIFWCSITAVVSGAFLFGNGKLDSTGNAPPQWLFIGFFGLFWAVGIGLAYAGCRNKYSKHRLTADSNTTTLRRELFGRAREKSLPSASITSISQVEFYQKNYEPVRGIEIRADRGKLRFGSVLTEDEKAWLVADLKRVILGVSASVAESSAARARLSCFSFALPASGRQLLPLSIMLTLMGAGFMAVAILFMTRDSGAPEPHIPSFLRGIGIFFETIGQGFRFIMILMSGLMAAGGIAMMTWMNRTKNQETRIEGSDSEVAIRTSRHGLVLKERIFPRASVTDIRSSVSGSSNGKTMKRVELIVGDQVETIARWIDGDKVDDLVEEVRRAL